MDGLVAASQASGTTGNPKGVLYCHRSTVLHTFSINLADSLAFTAHEVVLPVVPLFHVNAWGIPYAATMAGAKLVFPGPHLDPASLYELFEQEQVTMTAGVPTIWFKLLEYMDQTTASASPRSGAFWLADRPCRSR